MNDLKLDNFTALDLERVPLMEGAKTDWTAIEAELKTANLPRLDGDLSCDQGDIDREVRDARRCKNAVECLGGRLPGPNQAAHIVISGKHSLCDFIPAVLQIANPVTIATLRITTLGFSKENIATLCQLIDAGKIGTLAMAWSQYHKGLNGTISTYGATELAKRGMRYAILDVHAKLLVMRLSDGRTLSIESSANLRACHAIETAVASGSPAIHDFHATWIDGLLDKAKKPARPQEVQS